MLELILGKSIRKIETPTYEKFIDITPEGKSVRLDVYMNDDKNTVYDLEMQTTEERNLPKRARYYQGMIDLDFLEKGNEYDKLPYSLVIFICTFDYYKMGYPIYSFENQCAVDSSLSMGDQTRKVIVNLTGNRGSMTEDLCAFFDYLQFGIISDEFTKALDLALKKVKTHHEWEVEYMNWNAYEMDHRIDLRHAEEKGIEEGIKQGIEQGEDQTLDIVNLLLKGKSVDEIVAGGFKRSTVEKISGSLNL